MGQKINPYSFRLGLFLNWKVFFQCYGRLPNHYPWLLFNKHTILTYITKFIESKNYIINHKEKQYKVFYALCNTNFLDEPLRYSTINIFYSNFKIKTNKLTLRDNILKHKSLVYLFDIQFYRSLLFWNQNPIFLNIYKYHWFTNSQSIMTWIKINLQTRLKKKGVPVQQVLNSLLISLFKNHLSGFNLKSLYKKPLVISNSYGNFKYDIVGLKIQCKGWLRRSKRRRSSTVKWKLGNLPLHTLSNYIDYCQDILITRAGVVGLKVWLNLKISR